MKLTRAMFALVFAVVLLALPGLASAQGATAVSGTLSYRERVALPATAIVTVQVAQVFADRAPQVIAEQRFTTNGAQPPFRYSLPYDPARVDPNSTYTVQANITVGGQTYFRTNTLYPAITRGNPTQNVNITLVAASSLPNTSGGASTLLIAAVAGLMALAVFATRRVLGRGRTLA
jgi:putative lipoprotein